MTTLDWPEEERARYELALNLIADMVGLRSSWVDEELKMSKPNEQKIAIWRAEQIAFDKEQDGLDPRNREQIESIIDRYGPVLRVVYS